MAEGELHGDEHETDIPPCPQCDSPDDVVLADNAGWFPEWDEPAAAAASA